ncbi:MAG: glycosyltransferase family 4 protein [Myxococcales bacterium]|nr:glycosyltransferase family 4 protein [Myxococcales bacterium]
MRLLFLGVHGRDRSPSQRYRFEQFEPALAAAGIEVEYAGALTVAEADVFYGAHSPPTKGLVAARALARRLWSLAPRLVRPRFDVVFVQREAFFLSNQWAEWLAHLQAPVVFDFDDAIWIHAVSEANQRFAFLKNVDKIPRIVRLAHTVIAGNDYLASWARAHNSNVHVIPTCVDTDRWVPGPPRPAGRPVTIGWSGSATTIAHLRLALAALERVKARFGDHVRFRVMGDASFRHEPLQLAGEAWRPEVEIPFLQDLDVGLMPLPDDEWSKGKCGLKALTSMACGAAIVMSPVGVNTQIAQGSVTGFLPRTEDEWVHTLSRLVEDAHLRERVALAGRQRVVEAYSVVRWKNPFVDLLRAAASSR